MNPAAPEWKRTIVASGNGITITAVELTAAERAALNMGGARLPALCRDCGCAPCAWCREPEAP